MQHPSPTLSGVQTGLLENTNLLIAAAKPSHKTGPQQIVRLDWSQSPAAVVTYSDVYLRYSVLSYLKGAL
ncbi:hypothetical protein CBS63078_3003 [Aspergillus niger]|nr:hypothetical protein CBS115989_10268 [Aspergillus niger]KAI2833404.1 hypothetical protein CBS133816_274 [Aspergillus niger]KAI2838963.1 hypothetical protein CBS11350_7881 [Aspergillus niger]KAI2839550.1 hypothetical protein CBS11232_9331 [Aspergillus niger]KAI2863411.1 hypothetical protein CBS12448_3968 [Aspergillus niger]